MIIVSMTAMPVKMRKFVSRWLIEINPGTYAGHHSHRMEELLTERIMDAADNPRGRLVIMRSAHNDCRYELTVNNASTTEVDDIVFLNSATPNHYAEESRPS